MLSGGDRWISCLFHSALDTRNLLSCITQIGLTLGFQRNHLLIKTDWQLIRHKFLPRRLSQLLVWVEHTWYLLFPIFHPNPAAGTSWLTSRPIHSCSSSPPLPINTITQKLHISWYFPVLRLECLYHGLWSFFPLFSLWIVMKQHCLIKISVHQNSVENSWRNFYHVMALSKSSRIYSYIQKKDKNWGFHSGRTFLCNWERTKYHS